MKRKVLACITACALAVCCFVPVSFAATAVTDEASLRTAIEEGGTIDLNGKTIGLSSKLVIDNDVNITGGTLNGEFGGTGTANNVVEVVNGADVTLNNITIKSESNHALNVWGGNVTANNLILDHSKGQNGAPAVISNGSNAKFSGELTLKLGDESWYGINIDNSRVDFTGATITGVDTKVDTQSVVCIENPVSEGVTGLPVSLTEVRTADEQIAFVQDEDLSQFVAAKKDKDVTSVTLYDDVKLSAPLNLYNATKVIGNEYSIIGPDDVKDNVVTVWKDGTALNDLTIKTTASNKSALHLYKASATLTNVTLDNQETAGGAGMVVNGGKATIEGELNILLGANSWGGVNIDDQYGNSGMEFADGSTLTLTSPSNQDAIYIDRDEDNSVTVIGADKAGLEQDADGNYIIAKTEEPTDPSQPGDKPSQDEDKTPAADADKEAAADSPKTGDESASYGLLIALMLCSGAGIYALKRNAK